MAPIQPLATQQQQQSRSLRRGVLLQEGSSSPAGKIRQRSPPERSASFHGRTSTSSSISPGDHQQQSMAMGRQNNNNISLPRPKTQPDLRTSGSGSGRKHLYSTVPSPLLPAAADHRFFRLPNNIKITEKPEQQQQQQKRVPAKVLVNVNVQRSLGSLQIMASTDWTVEQLIAAAIKQYLKEGRRPPLPSTEPSAFGLHYSQFSLQCLDPKDKLLQLGSRNFFLCPNNIISSSSPILTSSSNSTAAESADPSSSSSCSREADKASKISIPWLRFIHLLF